MRRIVLCLAACMLFSGCSWEDFLTDVLADGQFSISEPEDGDIVNTETLRIAGEFLYTGDRDDDEEEKYDNDYNLFLVKIYLNDLLKGEATSSGDTVNFDLSVTLREGDNTIRLIGYYMDEEVRREEISIELDTVAPKVSISDTYVPPVTVSVLEFTGTVEYDELKALDYKTIFVNNSDPANPQTSDSAYNTLLYKDNLTGESGVWDIQFQNISETLYVDETTTGDTLTVIVRSQDKQGNSATVSRTMTVFSPNSSVR